MFCPKCGTENLDNARFCKKCRYEFPEKGPLLAIAKEGLITAKEKLVLVGKKVLPLMSKLGAKLSLFCKSTLIPFYQRKIKPNPKPFLLALLILIILGGGFFVYQTITSSKKVSETASLESLAIRFENWTNSYVLAKSASEETFDKWLKEGLELVNLYQKSVEVYLNSAQKLNPKYPEKFKELFEKDKIIREIEGYVELSELFDLRKTKEGEMIYKIFNESQILLNKVKITEGAWEIIEAKYQEKENNKIPIGYSFTINEPEDGTKQNITVIVKGVNKGKVNIITKEPKDGEKIIGTGSQEEVAKVVSAKLDEIIKLFQNQTFDANNILSFLEEKSKEKAIYWENEYKNTILNWRRFDQYEIVPGQTNFEKTSSYRISKSLPLRILLPVKVKYYQAGYWEESIPQIPFYYDKEKDDWVSVNETIEKIFNIIGNQVILAKASPDTFTFPKTKDCDISDREVKIENINISGKNTLKGDFSKSISSIIFTIGNYQSEPINIDGTLLPDLISYVNNNKKTTWVGKTFKYQYSGWWSSANCEASPNITFTFFSE